VCWGVRVGWGRWRREMERLNNCRLYGFLKGCWVGLLNENG
jgi:hypothetical protein